MTNPSWHSDEIQKEVSVIKKKKKKKKRQKKALFFLFVTGPIEIKEGWLILGLSSFLPSQDKQRRDVFVPVSLWFSGVLNHVAGVS